jgi:hypothetical protein
VALWRRAAPYLIPSLVFLAIVLALFYRVWTPIDGARKAFGWDAQWEYWGDLQFQLDSYRAGELPLWNPFDRAGYPFHADPQAGILYPVTWILLVVAAIAKSPYWVIAVKIIFHFWLAGVGVYAYLRHRKLPLAACYAGGLLFIITYPFCHNDFSALNWSMAWAPWALLAVEVWAEGPTAGRAAAVALTVGLGNLAGALAGFWYTLLVVGPYGVYALVRAARSAPVRREYLRAAARTGALSLALFVAMIAAQLLATRALVPHTVRDVRDFDFIGFSAFGPDDLISFVIPRFPGENTYMGFAAILWVAAALTLKPDPRRLTLAGIALLGILCALGNFGPYLTFGASLAPPFGFFRRAHRYLYVVILPLAILGAEGLTDLARIGRAEGANAPRTASPGGDAPLVESAQLRKRVLMVILALATIAVIIFGCGVAVRVKPNLNEEPVRDAFAFALAAAVVGTWVTVMVVIGGEKLRHVFMIVAVVVLGLDLWNAQTKKIELNMHPVPRPTRDAMARKLDGVPASFRIYDREYFGWRPGIRLQVRDLGGYEGDPLALRRFARFLQVVQRDPTQLAHANARYLTDVQKSKPLPKQGLKALQGGVWEVPDPAPRVLWIDSAQVVADDDAALSALRGAKPGTVAILERGTLTPDEIARAAQSGAKPPTPGRVLAWSRNGLTAEIDAPDDGIVVVNEAFFPGWRASVDGRAARIVPANSLFRGVFVPAGHHLIHMTYPATTWVLLAPVSILAFLAALALMLRGRLRRT